MKPTFLKMNKSVCLPGLEYPGYDRILSGPFLSLWIPPYPGLWQLHYYLAKQENQRRASVAVPYECVGMYAVLSPTSQLRRDGILSMIIKCGRSFCCDFVGYVVSVQRFADFYMKGQREQMKWISSHKGLTTCCFFFMQRSSRDLLMNSEQSWNWLFSLHKVQGRHS